MAARTPRLIGAVIAGVAIAGTGVAAPDAAVGAAACVTAPNAPVPPGGHWYYRIDHAQNRKCWYLQTGAAPQGHAAATSTNDAAPAKSQPSPGADAYSFASFKAFMARRGGGSLNDKDVKTLYAEFLAWNRHAKE